ncbi:MAG: hypothetical protein GY929_10410 [Actinomycetia bacterium]|nr:hypothetical protein [Actinomycetes bacterium]
MLHDTRTPSRRSARLLAGVTVSAGMLFAGTGMAAAQTDLNPGSSLGTPSLSLETHTNGHDLDTISDAIDLTVGDTAALSYIVTNTGSTNLDLVSVTDNDLGTICVINRLVPGAVHVCQATKTVTPGLWSAQGLASGKPVDAAWLEFPAGTVDWATDQDSSYHIGVGQPSIDIEKSVNGHDADTEADAAVLTVGEAITWTYVVTNTSGLPLEMVTVSDDVLGTVCVLDGSLAAGEQHTCTMSGVAQEGLHGMTGSVSAVPMEGSNGVFDSDPSWYKATVATTTTTQATTTTTTQATTTTTAPEVLGTTVVKTTSDTTPQVLALTGSTTTGLGVAGGALLAAGLGLIAAMRRRFGLD